MITTQRPVLITTQTCFDPTKTCFNHHTKTCFDHYTKTCFEHHTKTCFDHHKDKPLPVPLPYKVLDQTQVLRMVKQLWQLTYIVQLHIQRQEAGLQRLTALQQTADMYVTRRNITFYLHMHLQPVSYTHLRAHETA